MKTKLFFLLTLLFVTIGFSQISFNSNLIYQNNSFTISPQSIASGDIDNDGDIDIVVASLDDDKISWYENINGQDEFTIQHTISILVNGAKYISLVDIDADGDLDILTAARIDHKCYIFQNDGAGGFGERIELSSSPFNAKKIEAYDIDNDGDFDIVASGESIVMWFQNLDGLGNYGSAIIIDDYGKDFDVADIDGDNDLDIVCFTRDENFQYKTVYYENLDGLGSFGGQEFIANQDYFDSRIKLIDRNDDGYKDIFISDYQSIKWFENQNGSGVFSQEEIILDDSPADILLEVLLDINNDNLLDIVYLTTDSKVYLREAIDLNSFGLDQLLISDTNETRTLELVDLNANGFYDIVTNNINTLRAYYNNNDNSYSLPLDLSSFISGYSQLLSNDLDNDIDNDIIAITDNTIYCFENLGDQNFEQPKKIYEEFLGFGITYTLDLDNDGLIDIITIADEEIIWLKNNGNFNFSLNQELTPNLSFIENVHYMDLSDVDDDGDIDVIAALRVNNSYGRLIWFQNTDGNGNFGPEQLISDEYAFRNIVCGDIDGDGDVDIVAFGAFSSGGIASYENSDGLGNFNFKQLIVSGSDGEIFASGRNLNLFDVDNDNDLDLIYDSISGIKYVENFSDLDVYTNAYSFGLESSSTANWGFYDIDNDGDLDHILIYQGGKIAWQNNINDQIEFESANIISNLSFFNTEHGLITDLDLDGDNDIVALNNTGTTVDFSNLVWLENIGGSNEINGSIIFDIDSNGCDSNDLLLSNVLVTTTNSLDNYRTFTSTNGEFKMFVNEGDFSTTVNFEVPEYYIINPNSGVSSFIGVGNTDIVDFCIEPMEDINDLNISVYPSQDDPRPGFNTTYQLVYKNVGTTQLSGSVTFEFDDSKIQFLTASETVSSQTANTLTFDFVDLNPFETRTIDLEFNVFAPPTTNIGDVLISTATVNPVTGDETEEDNVFVLEQTVIGSYDPNDIQVLEGDQILLADVEKYLHYIIRFQNTGTASAINVNVENVLDDKLDWTTMQLESLSHTGRVEIANGTNVDFIFDNINLPDSTSDEPNSHGFIAYKIKPKTDVIIGDIMYNTADIFFDFNPAITTNTVSTEIVDALSVNEYNSNSFSLYPNPTSNTLTIVGKNSFETVKVYDINGRILKKVGLPDSKTEFQLNVEDISNGIYFVEIQSGSAKHIQKFIKK